MLVGNKADLKHLREIPEDRATSFCEEHGLNLVETSAKDNSNVEFAFQKLITEIYHEIIRKNVLDNDGGTTSFILLLSIFLMHENTCKQNSRKKTKNHQKHNFLSAIHFLPFLSERKATAFLVKNFWRE